MPEMPDEQSVAECIAVYSNSNIEPIDKALRVMLYLMRTQLFYDGNKRIAMLIANKIMIENGQGIISVAQSDISEFYKLLVEFYETNDGENFKKFIYDNCIDGMNFTK